MTEVRIQPWPLPTIPGQATNEGGGDEGGTVEYVDMDGMVCSASLKADKGSGPWRYYARAPPSDTIVDRSGLKIEVSGVNVMDVTGLSVVMEVKINPVQVTGSDSYSRSFVIKTKNISKAFAVGANINRTIDFNGLAATDVMTANNSPVDKIGFEYNGYTLTPAEGSVKLKVMNPMGVVLQSKTVPFTVSEVVYS